jgi:2-polyprenyl-6-methoxyphenol hydroxylase-like FAD-dependent oxidoreductase
LTFKKAILHCLLKWGMSKSFDVCIRGDGVVGRTLALLLARERLRVALVTRPAQAPGETPAADVRAYALNSAARQLLETLRVWPDLPFATPVRQMQVWGDNGGQIDFSADSLAQDALAWIVDVPALEQQLIQAVRYQPQIELVQAPVPAALTVVCEGKHSRSRDEFGAQWTVKPYPQKAIAARLTADKPHDGIARQWFAGGDILALLPLGGVDGNSVALVWSVSPEHAERLEQLAPEDFCIALQAVYGEEIVQALGSLHLSSERVSWPLALANAAHWVGPGWALAGDAAHTVHPLSGQGLNLGLADAACLAGVLGQREPWRALGDEKLLRRYERSRKGDVLVMDAVTDGLHALFAQSASPWQMARNWGMKGFAQSGLLKHWMARQAAGL